MSQTVTAPSLYSGVTMTAVVCANDSDTVEATLTGTEATNRLGFFTFTDSADLDGLYSFTFFANGSPIGLTLWANMTGEDGTTYELTTKELAMQADEADLPQVQYQVAFGMTSAEISQTVLQCVTGETGVTKTIAVLDENSDPLPLAGFGELRIVIETLKPRKVDVQVVEDADITIGGTDGNELTFQPSEDVLAKEAQYSYAVRQVSTGKVLIQGPLIVLYAPEVDS